MVELVVLQSLSYMAGALGVCVAAIYYVMSIRNAEKARRREIIFRKLPNQDRYYYDAFYTVAKMTDFNTPEEFREKYNYWVNHDAWCKLMYILNNYNLVGMLLTEKLASPEEIFQIYPPNMFVGFYEKFEFVVKRNRVNLSGEEANPDFFKSLEMLYMEAKRRYPKLEVDLAGSHEESMERGRVKDKARNKTP